MKERGFTILEVVLLIAVVGIISGAIGYTVSNINKKEENKVNLESAGGSTQSQNNSETPKLPDLVDYKDGIKITKKSEVANLKDASDSFKEFISSQLNETQTFEDGCEFPLQINVQKIYKDEYATGGKGSCGGAMQLWNKQNGVWKGIYASQEALDCDVANEFKIPSQLISTCVDYSSSEQAPVPNPN